MYIFLLTAIIEAPKVGTVFRTRNVVNDAIILEAMASVVVVIVDLGSRNYRLNVDYIPKESKLKLKIKGSVVAASLPPPAGDSPSTPLLTPAEAAAGSPARASRSRGGHWLWMW